MPDLDFAPVQQLVTLLRGTGMRADTNPEDLNPPGAWVTVEGIRVINLAGDYQLETVVYLIVNDQDYRRAYAKLAGLYNKARTVLRPDGLVVPQGVVMPDSSTPLPALRVPVHLT